MRSGWSLLAVVVLAACESRSIDAPPPVIAEGEGQAPTAAQPPSYLSAPVEFDLRPVLAELEQSIPRRIGSIDADTRVQVGTSPTVWLAAELERGPITFSFGDSTVSAATIFRYRGRAWVRTLFAAPSFSCGMEGQRPRMRVGVATMWGLTPEWRLRTRSRITVLEPVTRAERDQCEVSFLNIDVTGKVVDAASKGLRAALRTADQRIGRLELRDPVSHLWSTIQKPISIASGTLWLEIRPEAVWLGDVTARDSSIAARLYLRASPRIVSGTSTPDTTPLPPLEPMSGVDSVSVFMEGLLRYADANRILDEQLSGTSVRVGWRTVRIDEVEAMHGGAGRLILAVDLRGRARGRVYVVGTPKFDPLTDLITIPDLGFDVNTESYLDGTLAWLAQSALLGRIRERAKIPASSLLDMAVDLANEEIDRQLTGGVWLRGRVGTARTIHVRATAEGIAARAFGAGQLRLELSMQNLVPEIPDPVSSARRSR
ncbi:MAG: DUF4403 family protein [Gemmatimonadetes bacterium]|nr:DUF4403 family protein [Gemmatimonadota bacterium]